MLYMSMLSHLSNTFHQVSNSGLPLPSAKMCRASNILLAFRAGRCYLFTMPHLRLWKKRRPPVVGVVRQPG